MRGLSVCSPYPDHAQWYRVQVVASPGLSASLGVATHGFGKAAAGDAIRQLRAQAFAVDDLELAGDDPVQESRLTAIDLHLAQGMKTDDLHAAGKRVGDRDRRPA